MRVGLRLVATVLTSAVLLSACGTQIAGSAARPSPVLTPPGSPATAPTPTEPTGSDTSFESLGASGVAELTFGDTYTWEDGLRITVSAPTAFTPGRDAFFTESPAYAAFTITIANNSTTSYNPLDLTIGGQSGQAEMTPVWDESNAYTEAPSHALKNGDDTTFDLAFALSDPTDIVLDVLPGNDYYDAYFTATGSMSGATAAPAAPTTPVVKESDSDHATYGQTYQWDNGLQVTVSAPTPFVPGEYAETVPAPAYLSVTITVVNNTGELFEPYYLTVNGKSAGTKSGDVWDTDNDYSGAPFTGLFNGRTSTFKVGFAVADPNDLDVEVTPGYDYFAARFTS